ncbi:hypothetical protein EDB85DRAFT_1886991 [Lactarius pseudohatsudake]|nr:hypothetical protein EDB85DRAFT_1886991 [Lactarius pseudohatsudake]
MSGRGKYTHEEAADPAVRRMGRQGQKAVLVRPFPRERGDMDMGEGHEGRGSGGDRERGNGGVLSPSARTWRRGHGGRGDGGDREGAATACSRVAWAWGKGKGTGSGVPPFRVNGAAVNGKGKGRRQATYLVCPLFAHERGGARCGGISCALLRPLLNANGRATDWEKWGPGENKNRVSEPEPCSGSKHVPLTWQARTCSSVPSPLWVPLRIALPPLASPGPIRFEKGMQEGTADASASRAAPFVRKKRAHEGGARGHTATPLSPSTPLPLPLWLSLPASAEGAHAAAASPSPVALPPLSRGRRAHESTRPPPLSHRRATPFARKGGTPLPVPLPFPHVHVTPFAREGAHKDGLLSLSPHASHSRVRGLLARIFTAPAHFRAT